MILLTDFFDMNYSNECVWPLWSSVLKCVSCLNDSRKANSANMAPISCHLPAREHMAGDALVWWKQTQQGQSTSDQQTEVQTLIKNKKRDKNVMQFVLVLRVCYKLMCFSQCGSYACNLKEHLRVSPKPPEDDSSGHVFTGWKHQFSKRDGCIAQVDRFLSLFLSLSFYDPTW